MTGARQRFRGRIAGVGSTSGVRVVVGSWTDTPLGSFGDAMVETASGHRVLLAPHRDAADFIAATYTFDETRIEPLEVDGQWQVRSPSLHLDLTVGARTPLGLALRAVPRGLAESPAWCAHRAARPGRPGRSARTRRATPPGRAAPRAAPAPAACGPRR